MLRLLIAAIGLLAALGAGDYAKHTSSSLYLDVTPANLPDSFAKIRSLQLSKYELKYDSVQGRKHVGVLGAEAQRNFPEAIEVVPKYSFPSKNRSEIITIPNFPVVDKQVILMHAVAALQHLVSAYDDLSRSTATCLAHDQHIHDLIENLAKSIHGNTNEDLNELMRAVERENSLIREQIRLDELALLEQQNIDNQKILYEKEKLEREEELSRKRLVQEEKLQKLAIVEKLNVERQLAERREHLRRQTHQELQAKREEYANALQMKRIEAEKEKITAELEAKAKLEVQNEDLTIRRMQLQAKLDTDRSIDIIRSLSSQLSSIASKFITSPRDLLYPIGGLLLLLAAYFALREIFALAKAAFESRFRRPSLLRETSYEWTMLSVIRRTFNVFDRFRSQSYDSRQVERFFDDVVLPADNKQRILQLAVSTRNAKKAHAPYRHVLLFGPPGTGKTLIARRLAQSSDMDYAIMTGGDIGPLGENSVTQLHSLFSWATRSRRGLLIFIDEAEAFIASRTSSSGSENDHVKHAMNALLFHTGSQSYNFMLVLATNRPEDIDAAFIDRIDTSFHIDLPGVDEREMLLRLCMNNLLRNTADPSCVSDITLRSVASKCDGFSGREISKLVGTLQHSMASHGMKILSLELFYKVVEDKVFDHKQKMKFDVKTDNTIKQPSTSQKNSELAASRRAPRWAKISS